MARLTKEERKVFDPTLLIKNQKWKANQLLNESKNNEIAGRSEDAKNFLDTWRLNNLGTKDSGVLPPVDAVPPHLRGIIFKRADASTEGKTNMLAHGDGGGWEHLDKSAKDRIRRPEFEADIIKGLEDGSILPGDAAEMLRISEEELPTIINKFKGDQQKQSLKIGSTQVASNKTPSQQNATNMLKIIKDLERRGKYIDAKALYDEQFPKA